MARLARRLRRAAGGRGLAGIVRPTPNRRRRDAAILACPDPLPRRHVHPLPARSAPGGDARQPLSLLRRAGQGPAAVPRRAVGPVGRQRAAGDPGAHAPSRRPRAPCRRAGAARHRGGPGGPVVRPLPAHERRTVASPAQALAERIPRATGAAGARSRVAAAGCGAGFDADTRSGRHRPLPVCRAGAGPGLFHRPARCLRGGLCARYRRLPGGPAARRPRRPDRGRARGRRTAGRAVACPPGRSRRRPGAARIAAPGDRRRPGARAAGRQPGGAAVPIL